MQIVNIERPRLIVPRRKIERLFAPPPPPPPDSLLWAGYFASGASLPPPTFTALNHTLGGTEGGFNLTATGTNFVPGIVCEIVQGANLVVATATVTYNSASSLTLAMPAVAAGLYTIRLRNPDGQQVDFASYFEYFSPTSLALDGYFRDIGALPKAGTASAGTSGASTNLTQTNGTMTFGSVAFGSAGSRGTAIFSGTSAMGAATASAYVSQTTQTIFGVVYQPATPNAAGSSYLNEGNIAGDNGGNWGLSLTASGLRTTVFSGSAKPTGFVAAATGFHVFAGRWDTTGVDAMIDGTFATPNAWTAGSGPMSSNLHIGKNWTSANFVASGTALVEIAFSKTSISNATLAKIRAYYRAMYQGLALP